MFIKTDWVLYEFLKSKELILSRIAEHVRAVNSIYSASDFVSFDGHVFRDINFKVIRVKVHLLVCTILSWK